MEILHLYQQLLVNNEASLKDAIHLKQHELSSCLQERPKRALIRSSFITSHHSCLVLRRGLGRINKCPVFKLLMVIETSDPSEVRRLAAHIYTDLYAAEGGRRSTEYG